MIDADDDLAVHPNSSPQLLRSPVVCQLKRELADRRRWRVGDVRPVGRRFVIAVGIGSYNEPDHSDLPGAPVDAQRVVTLLGSLGYEQILPDLAALPAIEVIDAVDAWVASAALDQNDIVVVYFAGHGVVGADRHYLEWHDSVADRRGRSLASVEFARPLLESKVGHLLVMLDTCYAGGGADDITTLAAGLTRTQRHVAGRWSLVSARSEDRAREQYFVDALEHALTSPDAGARQRFVGIREITDRVNELLQERKALQRARFHAVDSDGYAPFFANPLFIADLPRNDLSVVTLNLLRKKHGSHFDARARGVDHLTDRGDYFTARGVALRELSMWLGADEHDRRAKVVTGDPGSGKSALLGRLLLLFDPDSPQRAHHDFEELPPAGMPVIPLYARRVTLESLTRDLADALDLKDPDLGDVLAALASRDDPIAIVVDALD